MLKLLCFVKPLFLNWVTRKDCTIELHLLKLTDSIFTATKLFMVANISRNAFYYKEHNERGNCHIQKCIIFAEGRPIRYNI